MNDITIADIFYFLGAVAFAVFIFAALGVGIEVFN